MYFQKYTYFMHTHILVIAYIICVVLFDEVMLDLWLEVDSKFVAVATCDSLDIISGRLE